MQIESIVGITAGIFTAASMIPQLVKMLREKKYEAVSPLMLFILLLGLILWVSYGILKNDFPIILTNAISLLLNLVMLILRLRYKMKTNH